MVAPAGDVARICVADTTVKPAAGTLLKRTPVTFVKFVPTIVTLVNAGPDAGAMLAMFGAGAGSTVKLPPVIMPPGAATIIGPFVAPTGTVTAIWLSEFATKLEAGVPLNSTAVAPVKPVPLTNTVEPTVDEVGDTLEKVGAGGGVTVKFVALVPMPPGPMTLIFPVVAASGTLNTII